MDNQQMQALLMLGQLASKGQQGNQLDQLAPLLMMMKGSNAGQASGKGQQQTNNGQPPTAAPTTMNFGGPTEAAPQMAKLDLAAPTAGPANAAAIDISKFSPEFLAGFQRGYGG